jgi:hypothetical protein
MTRDRIDEEDDDGDGLYFLFSALTFEEGTQGWRHLQTAVACACTCTAGPQPWQHRRPPQCPRQAAVVSTDRTSRRERMVATMTASNVASITGAATHGATGSDGGMVVRSRGSQQIGLQYGDDCRQSQTHAPSWEVASWGRVGGWGGGRTAVVARSRGHRIGVTGWTTCGARRGTILHLLAGHGRRRGRGIGGFVRCGEPRGLRPGVTRGGASG